MNVFISGSFSLSFLEFFSANIPIICTIIGVATTIIIGGTDISLGSIVSMTNVIMVTLVGFGVPIPMAAFLSLLSAILAGVINGAKIAFIRINPLLTTFATSTVYAGIALWILPYPGGFIPYEYSNWFNSYLFGFIPIVVIVVIGGAKISGEGYIYWMYFWKFSSCFIN